MWAVLRSMGSAVAVLAAVGGAAAAATPGVVVQHGEIVIMEGDAEIVGGDPGVRYLGDDNAIALLDRFYQHYPDEFDMVVVFMTWTDNAIGGAYYTSAVPTPSLRSFGFVDMNRVGYWGIDVIPVIGQEFSHAWLAYASFVDPISGQVSDEMLGRDFAHWSALLDADGSVQDGIDWEDNGDGTFTVVGKDNKWSMVDLWYMGFVAQDEVSDFFVLRDAVPMGGGEPLTRYTRPAVGDTVTATKVVLTIEDIVAADGPQPPIDERQKDFRLAFVMVTDIGESAQSAVGTAEQLDRIRNDWNASAEQWLLGRGSMCTDTTAPCDIPHARVAGGRFLEGDPSDGDGIVEPGEHAFAEVSFSNTGNGVAAGVAASLTPADPVYPMPADVMLDDIEPGDEVTGRFDVEVPAGAMCGANNVFHVEARLDGRRWQGDLVLVPGVIEGSVEDFGTAAGWQANADMSDTAIEGGWEHGVGEATEYDGRVLQAEGGAGGREDPAWWTGIDAGIDWKANDLDTGVTTLTSPPLDLSASYRPAVRYKVWYVANSINTGVPLPTQGDDLVVEASKDGVDWVEIDRVSGTPLAWQAREASLAAVAGSASARVRFVARDQGPEQNLVEVGIDDVQLVRLSESCEGGGGGCGCEVAHRESPRSPAALAFAAAVLALRIRRRRRDRPSARP